MRKLQDALTAITAAVILLGVMATVTLLVIKLALWVFA